MLFLFFFFFFLVCFFQCFNWCVPPPLYLQCPLVPTKMWSCSRSRSSPVQNHLLDIWVGKSLLNTYERFFMQNTLHHQHQNPEWGNILCRNAVHHSSGLSETMPVYVREHWSCYWGPDRCTQIFFKTDCILAFCPNTALYVSDNGLFAKFHYEVWSLKLKFHCCCVNREIWVFSLGCPRHCVIHPETWFVLCVWWLGLEYSKAQSSSNLHHHQCWLAIVTLRK